MTDEHLTCGGNNALNAQFRNFYFMKNVGGRERTLRAVFGSGIVIFDFLATVHIEIVFLVVGLWGVLTSAFGYCPFNGLLNRNTCELEIKPVQA